MLTRIRKVAELREIGREWVRAGRRVGFVPTMGALHEGHASLVRVAKAECERTVVSIFVNPMQFDRKSDLASYPRSEDADCLLLAEAGADVVFLPEVDEVYPSGYATRVDQVGLPDHLCGASRPGHFTGVMTVVTKLFNMVAPDRAYFGRKDYQQAAIIRRMTADLNLPIDIRVMPIVREADGLAMSSRNRLLKPDHRAAAPGLLASMRRADRRFRSGDASAASLETELKEGLAALPGARVDYARISDPVTLEPRTGAVRPGDVLAVAVFFGEVRLIDNLLLGVDADEAP